jgi:Tfp pilus assembly protein PilX
MKKLPDFSCDLTRRKKGFALVLALSLMSLVFLLVVSLVSLVSTDLNLSELRKQKVIAQANARLGMMVALGEIQKHLGPDTRVTATADILDERVESGSAYLTQGY